MPIYEYQCQRCGAISEFLIVGAADDKIQCEECGGTEMTKIISASSFTLSTSPRMPGRTCCGREERCDAPPCSGGGSCHREG